MIKNYLVPRNYITTSYEVYKDRTQSSFELLDSIKDENIYTFEMVENAKPSPDIYLKIIQLA